MDLHNAELSQSLHVRSLSFAILVIAGRSFDMDRVNFSVFLDKNMDGISANKIQRGAGTAIPSIQQCTIVTKRRVQKRTSQFDGFVVRCIGKPSASASLLLLSLLTVSMPAVVVGIAAVRRQR